MNGPKAGGNLARFVFVAVGVPAAIVSACMLTFPHVRTSPALADFVTFLGAAAVSTASVAAAARIPLAAREAVVVVVAGIVGIGAFALARIASAWGAVGVDAALIASACALGAFIGARVQHPGHLLPACAVAACADVVSVVSPSGPTHAMAASERALAALAVSFPVPGTSVVAPALGAGDLVFIALVLGAVFAHRLPYVRATALCFAGILAAGVGAAIIRLPVPALPLIGGAVVVGIPQARRLRAKDRTVAWISIGVSLVVAAATMVSNLPRGSGGAGVR